MFGVPADMNSQEQVMSEFQILSAMTGQGVIVDSDASITGLDQFTRSSLQDSLSSFLISDATRTHGLNAFSDALDLSFASPVDCGYDEVLGNLTGSNGWSKFSNKLSLSLATSSQSSGHRTSFVPDQCSELSLSFGSDKPPQFSQANHEPRYLEIVQEILAQIANYSLNNSNPTNYCYSSDNHRGAFLSSEADCRFDKIAVETKKTELLTLLQAVDHRYSRSMDEINNVVSAFHAVTSLDPQIHCCFALGTVSCLYKRLRERISNLILSLGANGAEEKERSLEPSFVKKQWAQTQQKRKEHLWRPQRGLPEKSVSVLRAWMFQNFLHPYPKDSEKHWLAMRSGLSRNQVSNWFINARVRLWKPMIEEMYSEMKVREGRDWYEEGSNNVRRISQKGLSNVRYIV